MEKDTMILRIAVGTNGNCSVGYDKGQIENAADFLDALSDGFYALLKFYDKLPSNSPLRSVDSDSQAPDAEQLLLNAVDIAISKYRDFENGD